jgi:CRP-like cAMP-binding protein/MFS family permease
MGRGRLAKWFGSYRSALATRDLRLLFSGLTISATGSWAYNVALLAFVYNRTHSLGWVGAAGLGRYVPALLLSTYAGVIAERTERIRLLIGSDVVSALWQVGLALTAAANGPAALAIVFAALTSVSNLVYPPAVAATIPSLVDEDSLVAANALNGTIENLVVISGPAVGAALLVFGSTTLVFAVNAGSFLVSAVLVSRIRTRSRPVDVTEEGSAGPLAQMGVGIRTILGLSAARTLVAYCALVSFVYGTDTVLFVGVGQHKLAVGAKGFGYLLAGLGVGGILMAAAVDKLAGWGRLGPIIIAGVAGYTLPTALLTVVHNVPIAIVLQVLRGGSTLVVDVLAITSLQRAVPSDQLARVFGVFFAFVLGAISLGALLTPVVIKVWNLDGALLTMAFAPFALAMIGYPSLMAIDRASAARAASLAPKVAILEQLGIFAAARRPVLERLAEISTVQEFAAASPIVREGEAADALYVLVEGEVEVTAHGEFGGAEKRLRTMQAPTYFGEIGVLEQIPRTATVTAIMDCRCERIDGAALLDALTSAPPSASLMENARARLALTHPSRNIQFTGADAELTAERT